MTKKVAKSIVRGITDKIEANTTDIDDWAKFWGFTRDDYEEFLEMPIKLLFKEEQMSIIDYVNRYTTEGVTTNDDIFTKIKGYVDHIRNTGMGKEKSLEFIEKFIEGLKEESEVSDADIT